MQFPAAFLRGLAIAYAVAFAYFLSASSSMAREPFIVVILYAVALLQTGYLAYALWRFAGYRPPHARMIRIASNLAATGLLACMAAYAAGMVLPVAYPAVGMAAYLFTTNAACIFSALSLLRSAGSSAR